MSTHVAAFVLAALAYSFGTGKISVLGGFTSAVVLSIIALLMAGQSVHRLFAPQVIHFREAIIIASIGLAVNLICALLLKDDPHHDAGAFKGWLSTAYFGIGHYVPA